MAGHKLFLYPDDVALAFTKELPNLFQMLIIP
jgi:hypothetical protein